MEPDTVAAVLSLADAPATMLLVWIVWRQLAELNQAVREAATNARTEAAEIRGVLGALEERTRQRYPAPTR